MYINSEGIIFRQVKATGGRRMILLFTKKYGKISAGSNINEKGRTKSALAMRPFTYGTYELYKTGNTTISTVLMLKKLFPNWGRRGQVYAGFLCSGADRKDGSGGFAATQIVQSAD